MGVNSSGFETSVWYLSWSGPACHLVAGWLHWIPSIKEAAGTGTGNYSSYVFAFSACHASTSNIISGFTECLIHNHGSPNSIASGQRLHFSAKEVKVSMRFTGLATYSYHQDHLS